MDYQILKSKDRAYFNHGWLKTRHTFSFGDYYDEKHMNFRALRVINEDIVAESKGFPTHSHRNMEIITYVLSGQIAHKDSLGTESILNENEFQLMHAGSAIAHSEYNPSTSKPVHFLQIWLTPDEHNAAPGYQQVLPKLTDNAWTLVASKDAHGDSLQINQDSKVFLADLVEDKSVSLDITQYGWLQVVSGNFFLGNDTLEAGDGVAFNNACQYTLTAKSPGKVMLFLLT